jgi:hypothetical protein
MRKNILLLLSVSIAILATMYFISCGGGGSSGGGASTGSVALYITDSPKDDYKSVKITLNDVYLLHTGTNTPCDILEKPVSGIDITDLSSILKLLDISSGCDSRSYDRIHVEFVQQVKLTDMNDTQDTCNFTSYKDKDNNPQVLQCKDKSCFIDINDAVNVVEGQNNELTLDFELKDFEVVDFNSPDDCDVTIKVSPLNASEINAKYDDGYEEGITGYDSISNLNTSAKKFTLTAESGTFPVSYTNVTTQGIDDLLNLAATDQLEVTVEATSINLDGEIIDASAIFVEVKGTVPSIDLNAKTFMLTYQTSKTITVDYQNAEVEGVLVDNANVEVKLNGYDVSNYLSQEVEIED